MVVQLKYNAAKGSDDFYYRLKESYRNAKGNVCTRILLNIGFINPHLEPGQGRRIASLLTERKEMRNRPRQQNLFSADEAPRIIELVDRYWQEMLDNGRIDLCDAAKEAEKVKSRHMIDGESMKHTEAREIGGENICWQTIQQLGLDSFLQKRGWSNDRVKMAMAHLIVRSLYAPSENKAIDIIRENSAVCELLGIDGNTVTKYKTYKVAPELYKMKEELDAYLCNQTDNLFNITNKICLFDLTNFYYEGRKDGNEKAAFGRSKEKRSDCKLTVLALCINKEGFIRHSELLAGNTADPASLPAMVETLLKRSAVQTTPDKTLVVMDAGIATEDNLTILRSQGFNYLCVSRRKLNGSDYTVKAETQYVRVQDCRKREITLTRIERNESNGDYYLRIDSPAKAVKEESMAKSAKMRFEDGLNKIKNALGKKHGTKKLDKVWERIGRLNNEYPSIGRYYNIEVTKDDKKETATDMTWTCTKKLQDMTNGVYFMRTNVETLDEKTTWEYYNLIREIECTNRQLKTDLNLRPIYHQQDDNCDAHLYFGLLAYWIVNTVRYQLKEKGENMYWTEIVRIMKTQKAVTTEATNGLGEHVEYRICTEPTIKAKEIYDKLRYRQKPFRRKLKICSTPNLI